MEPDGALDEVAGLWVIVAECGCKDVHWEHALFSRLAIIRHGLNIEEPAGRERIVCRDLTDALDASDERSMIVLAAVKRA